MFSLTEFHGCGGHGQHYKEPKGHGGQFNKFAEVKNRNEAHINRKSAVLTKKTTVPQANFQ